MRITKTVRVAVTVDVEADQGGGRWRRTARMEGHIDAASPEVLGGEFDNIVGPAADMAAKVTLGAGRAAWLAIQKQMFDHDEQLNQKQAYMEAEAAEVAEQETPLEGPAVQ